MSESSESPTRRWSAHISRIRVVSVRRAKKKRRKSVKSRARGMQITGASATRRARARAQEAEKQDKKTVVRASTQWRTRRREACLQRYQSGVSDGLRAPPITLELSPRSGTRAPQFLPMRASRQTRWPRALAASSRGVGQQRIQPHFTIADSRDRFSRGPSRGPGRAHLRGL